MAFDILNENTKAPTTFYELPASRVELADQTADIAAQDMGVVGLKYLRGRVRVKTLTGTFAFRVNVDTVVGMSSPEYIYQSPTYADGEPICVDFVAWSNDGFQFVNFDVTFGTSGTFDLILEAI